MNRLNYKPEAPICKDKVLMLLVNPCTCVYLLMSESSAGRSDLSVISCTCILGRYLVLWVYLEGVVHSTPRVQTG